MRPILVALFLILPVVGLVSRAAGQPTPESPTQPPRAYGTFPVIEEQQDRFTGTETLSANWLALGPATGVSGGLTLSLSRMRLSGGAPSISLTVIAYSPEWIMLRDPPLDLLLDGKPSRFSVKRMPGKVRDNGTVVEAALVTITCRDVRKLAAASMIEGKISYRAGAMNAEAVGVLRQFADMACPGKAAKRPAPAAKP